MSTIPASIAAKLEKIIRDFLWLDNDPNTTFYWINWDDVGRLKHEGGLGIRCVLKMNEARKAKWLWRFANEEDALWKKVIVMKCGVDNFGWWSKKISCGHRVGWWKSIMSGFDHFYSLIQFKVKNGSKVLF